MRHPQNCSAGHSVWLKEKDYQIIPNKSKEREKGGSIFNAKTQWRQDAKMIVNYFFAPLRLRAFALFFFLNFVLQFFLLCILLWENVF